MARAISDEELQLKKRARRRLVGAIALVLVVVVFLPMFLDSEPQPLNQDIAINIPPIPEPEPAEPAPPVDPARAPTALPGLPPPPEEAAPAEAAPVSPAARAPAAPPATESKPAPARAEAEKPAAKPRSAASGDEYVVQLGAFSNAANAKALQKKLQENKFNAYTELIKSSGGERTRVRVGPYPTREAAEKARTQLKARKLVIGDATVVRKGD